MARRVGSLASPSGRLLSVVINPIRMGDKVIKTINPIELDERLRPQMRETLFRFSSKFEPTLKNLKEEVYAAWELGFDSGRAYEASLHKPLKQPRTSTLYHTR